MEALNEVRKGCETCTRTDRQPTISIGIPYVCARALLLCIVAVFVCVRNYC